MPYESGFRGNTSAAFNVLIKHTYMIYTITKTGFMDQ
jgi:hypothetical protein